MSFRPYLRPRRAVVAMALSVCVLCAGPLFAAPGQEDSRKAKIAELIQLQGLAGMMEQSKAAGQEQAAQVIRSMTDKIFAQFPTIAPQKRTAIEAAAQQFSREIQNSFDQDDAVLAWGRFYSDGLTDQELDAILAYYRSPAGQKDVRASQTALPQFQKYLIEKQTAARNTAIANYAAALREIANPSKLAPQQPDSPPPRPAGSDPSVPDGKVIADSVSDRCEAPPSAASQARNTPASGRSVLCVCVDEKGKLTQEPVIAESSGDARVDSGAVKLARMNSGRYTPPGLDGKPQKGCFRYSVNFRHPE
ncbi:MAG: DUF2059 domain-containing protein [Steroidobacteraceae bacterium]